MRAIVPESITDSTLTSSDVPENDEPLWSSATSYSVGNTVMETTPNIHKRYECLIANTNQQPSTSPLDGSGNPYWLELGPTNRWAVFDEVVGTQTAQTGSFQHVIEPGVSINALGFVNLDANSITVLVTSVNGGGTVYSKTFELLDNTQITDWYQYYFSGFRTKKNLYVDAIPGYSDMVITITVDNGSDVAKAGVIVVGNEIIIGETLSGMTPEIRDYSRISTDTFGNTVITRRTTSRRFTATAAVDKINLDYLVDIMDENASVPLLWNASDTFTSGIVYGFYKDFSPEFTANEKSYVTFDIEGLT